MIGREFLKRLRLMGGRSETIRTRFELDGLGRLVEHVVIETHDRFALVPRDRPHLQRRLSSKRT
jgi:hypothetical protein